ncbi:hypothetical protein ASG22_19620 [Chryseobacterium sp. Leaf405]|uniref:ParB/RepB/Spo0J family partition protein n=1 Tax=Chryseobacterium sp. Leaf405 TaxID=1736367 RepID=UPI0006F34EAA|nr:ParB/RepB/Spo0J family partition protein [Chryseobacterium sp. Leaf405]KQT30906.1 hypothetical protein ASG22_19620 [Chryseobacterium sp. Leaf405]
MTPKTIQLFNNEYYVIYQHGNLTTIWELQAHLSIADSATYNQLKHDIKQNGVHNPILYYTLGDGIKLVLDGHSRLKACIELKISNFPTKEIKEDFETLSDIQFWMVKNQCQRRNLTPVEKLKFACLHEETIVKKAKENLSKAGRGDNVKDKIDTILEISKLAGIGRTTTARYRSVINSGFYGIIRQMMNGNLSITTAYNQVQEKLKVGVNEINIISEIYDMLECESKQKHTDKFKTQEPKYVNDIHNGLHLLRDDEVEYFIMTKDKNKLSQKLNGKYAVFIMEQ